MNTLTPFPVNGQGSVTRLRAPSGPESFSPVRSRTRVRASLAFCALFAVGLAWLVPVHAGDAPTRVVPSAFVDTDATRSCGELIAEQGLARDKDRDIEALKAAIHACVKGRFERARAANPDRFPTHGRPETSRPK